MYFFTNVWFAAFVPATFIFINYISYKKDIIKVMERDQQDGLGTVYYALSLLILVIISFGIYNKPTLGLIPVLIMAYGDGLAAIIGRLIKSPRYKIVNSKKSFAGSITMFVISFIIIGAYLIYEQIPAYWGIEHTILMTSLMAFTLTGIEAISIKGTDNISVPLGTIIMLLLV